ncbi:MAG: radical SAM protein [Dialister sp.]|uniref:radical SAM/SPASM domain-containing protein n=1 Tax=Dialister sp. TaxID=1955814 RepID=UPI00257AEB25|nr:radical SAM protein [Dialister sp.]MBS6295491.1 radical SAM protein [Dialister sp.]
MSKEFDVNSKVNFPHNIVSKDIDGYHIIIAPDYPNWVVLDNQEYEIFRILSKNTIIDGLNMYYAAFPGNTEDDCVLAFTNFLAKIEECQFYEDAVSEEEEPVETIKKKVHITMTNNCNMRCPHCFVSAGMVEKQELNVEKILTVIGEIEKINGPTDIVVSGGEPLVHPGILQLLKGLKGHNVSLFSNGALINENNYAIIADCCQEVQISFEGVTQDAYERIRGRGNYNKALHAIELLKTTGIKITLAITIIPSTVENIRDHLIPFVNSFEYENLEIRLNDNIEMTGNALTMDFSGFDKYEVDKMMLSLVGQLQDMGVTKVASSGRNVKFRNCGIGTNIVVDANGKIYPCNKFSSYYCGLDEEMSLIFRDFNELNRSTSTDFMRKCKKCELRYICAGGCRIDYMNRHGDMLAVDCTPAFKENQYRKLLLDYLE